MYELTLSKVEVETADTKAFWFTPEPRYRNFFKFKAGQFIAFKIPIASGAVVRCYSMARASRDDGTICIGVKRVEGGLGSNWLHDHLKVGDRLQGSLPSGLFTLTSNPAPLKLFAAGSGITPILSLFETALAETERPIVLLYAIRDRDSIVFKTTIEELVARHPGRARVRYHFDGEAGGYLSKSELREWLGKNSDSEVYVCGPQIFMGLCAEAADEAGIPETALHIENFSLPAHEERRDLDAADAAGNDVALTVVLNGQSQTIKYHGQTTVLAAMKQAGLSPESSCEEGFCGACRALKVKGDIELAANYCLSNEDLDLGWILTCQARVKSEKAEIYFDNLDLGQTVRRDEALGGRGLDQIPMRRRRAAIALVSAAASFLIAIWVYLSPLHARLLNPGPMMPGHASLDCISCHQTAPGTTRQQIQAIVGKWLGWRHDNPQFAYMPPQNSDCADCHERANDRHPTNRFKEPRFLSALDIVDARTCMGCHTEHTGERVANNGQYCAACHKDVEAKHDPLETSHVALAAQNRWETCLQCHDFHGNHKRDIPRSLSMKLDLTAIENYLKDGADPFGPEKPNQAKRVR
ncbi:MAG TPA: 2Fe-2S iron-sulfur cluster-binding protein [Bradyrhizobium sp.]|nr:2Fe-2S iron-sulfur cluster-binding protein [Bradyrhizobium sp.]